LLCEFDAVAVTFITPNGLLDNSYARKLSREVKGDFFQMITIIYNRNRIFAVSFKKRTIIKYQ